MLRNAVGAVHVFRPATRCCWQLLQLLLLLLLLLLLRLPVSGSIAAAITAVSADYS